MSTCLRDGSATEMLVCSQDRLQLTALSDATNPALARLHKRLCSRPSCPRLTSDSSVFINHTCTAVGTLPGPSLNLSLLVCPTNQRLPSHHDNHIYQPATIIPPYSPSGGCASTTHACRDTVLHCTAPPPMFVKQHSTLLQHQPVR